MSSSYFLEVQQKTIQGKEFTLSSGRQLKEVKCLEEEDMKVQPQNEEVTELQVEETMQEKEEKEDERRLSTCKKKDKGQGKKLNPTPTYPPDLPFPSRLKNPREDWQYAKFLKMLIQLHVNIPFVDMPA